MSRTPDVSVYFEDIAIGDRMQAESYTLEREAMIRFAREFDPLAIHLDEAAAKDTITDGLIASGIHTLGAWSRLRAKALATHASVVGHGFDNLRFHKPVRPGDILRLQMQVIEKKDHPRRPEYGYVSVHSDVLNQAGEVVLSLDSTALYARRADDV